MKFFKTKASRISERYEITPKVFDKVTEHRHPYEQINPDKSIAQYGICPSCLNPIQLIGVAKKLKHDLMASTPERMFQDFLLGL